jgi:hypothetical protein
LAIARAPYLSPEFGIVAGHFSNGSGTVGDFELPPPDNWIMERPMNIWFHQRGAARKMLDIYVEDKRVSAADLSDENLWELAQQYVGSRTDDELRAELLRTTLCYYDGLRAWSSSPDPGRKPLRAASANT